AHRGSSPSDPNRAPGGDRQFTYYPEERYWTDYLRIAAPVLGVIILLALAWFWLSHLIGDNGGSAANATATSPSNLAVLASPTSTSGVKGTPQVVATATGSPTSGTPASTGGPIANGSKVVVANTGGTGVNMRDTAATSGTVVASLPEGAVLTVTGAPLRAEGHTWWPEPTSE